MAEIVNVVPGGGHVFANTLTVDGDGDGLDGHYADLPTAIVAASSGDVIVVYPGTYSLTATLEIPAGVAVVGVGSRLVIIESTASPCVDLGDGALLQGVTVTKTTASGYTIVADGTTATCRDVIGAPDNDSTAVFRNLNAAELELIECGAVGAVAYLLENATSAARTTWRGYQAQGTLAVRSGFGLFTIQGGDFDGHGLTVAADLSGSYVLIGTSSSQGIARLFGCRFQNTGTAGTAAFLQSSSNSASALELFGVSLAGIWTNTVSLTASQPAVTITGCVGFTVADIANSGGGALSLDGSVGGLRGVATVGNGNNSIGVSMGGVGATIVDGAPVFATLNETDGTISVVSAVVTAGTLTITTSANVTDDRLVAWHVDAR